MIELDGERLRFSFPDVHDGARLEVSFHRTLRIPDDGRSYPLPPGLGLFPVREVDEHAARVPPGWRERGGVMLPMYQSEALWLRFGPSFLPAHRHSYPFAIKVAAGMINAVTGDRFDAELRREPQDYVVAPKQPWLDGWCVEKGVVRQFVAMPLGAGFTAEEQLTGEAMHGGVQLCVMPMKREAFERRFPKSRVLDAIASTFGVGVTPPAPGASVAGMIPDLGLAAGGRMRQEIFEDPFDASDWESDGARVIVRLADSLMWHAITGDAPPTKPPTAKDYARARLPWFEYYDDGKAVAARPPIAGLKSVAELGTLPDNESVDVEKRVVELRAGMRKGQVREGSF